MLETTYSKVPELVKADWTTFTKFDPVRFKLTEKGDRDLGYYIVNNWVLIGSLGDPETWEGLAS